MADAMKIGRAKIETMKEESARLHSERLPYLRENQRLFEVSEAKKAAIMQGFVKMRADGLEVRRASAIALLTGPQVIKQIALRVFLDKVQVARRTGKKEEMVAVLKEMVAKEVEEREKEHGPDGYTSEEEGVRLRGLGLGKKQRGKKQRGKKQRARAQTREPKTRQPRERTDGEGVGIEEEWMSDDEEDSSEDGSEEDDGDEDDDEDGIDVDELLQQEDVYQVEKIVRSRVAKGGKGREFEVKWEGYSARQNTWEPEANLRLVNSRMLDRFLAREEKANEMESERREREQQAPACNPTRRLPARAAGAKAAAKARAANAADLASDDEEEEEEDDEEPSQWPKRKATSSSTAALRKARGKAPAAARPKPPARPKAPPAKRPKAAPAAGPSRPPAIDSSDEERKRLAAAPPPPANASSDELSGSPSDGDSDSSAPADDE